MATPLLIKDIPDHVVAKLKMRARQRGLSVAAYAREILLREATRATIEETLAGPRLRTGPPLSAAQIKRLIRSGRT